VRAGDLNRRVDILRQGSGQDEYGEPDGTWGTLLSQWAAVERVESPESLVSDELRTAGDLRIRMRWQQSHESVTVADRVKFRGTTYQIDAVTPVIDPVRGSRETIITASRFG
jgi:SPP1 family predicted phage head-tail adaptor